jgi:hypothetical protein
MKFVIKEKVPYLEVEYMQIMFRDARQSVSQF